MPARKAPITISGTTAVTSFGSTMKPGQSKIVIASGAWQLTYNSSSMKIPGSVSYTMAAGDKTIVTCVSAGNYDVMIFPKSGQSVAVGAVKVVPYTVITDSSDIVLSQVPTQTNIGSTRSVNIPTKGFLGIEFIGDLTSNSSATIWSSAAHRLDELLGDRRCRHRPDRPVLHGRHARREHHRDEQDPLHGWLR